MTSLYSHVFWWSIYLKGVSSSVIPRTLKCTPGLIKFESVVLHVAWTENQVEELNSLGNILSLHQKANRPMDFSNDNIQRFALTPEFHLSITALSTARGLSQSIDCAMDSPHKSCWYQTQLVENRGGPQEASQR